MGLLLGLTQVDLFDLFYIFFARVVLANIFYFFIPYFDLMVLNTAS